MDPVIIPHGPSGQQENPRGKTRLPAVLFRAEPFFRKKFFGRKSQLIGHTRKGVPVYRFVQLDVTAGDKTPPPDRPPFPDAPLLQPRELQSPESRGSAGVR